MARTWETLTIGGGPVVETAPVPPYEAENPDLSGLTELIQQNQKKEGEKVPPTYKAGAGLSLTVRTFAVELDDSVPGLKFDATGDDGQLMVKPDTTKGITVAADGVAAREGKGIDFLDGKIIADVVNPAGGLQFVGQGDAAQVAVLPDTTRGIDMDNDGVYAVIGDGLAFEANVGDFYVLPKPNSGILVEATGVSVIPDTNKAIRVGADGVGIALLTGGGLEFVGTAPNKELGVLTDEDRSLSVDGTGVYVMLCDGEGGLRHVPADDPHVAGLGLNLKPSGTGSQLEINASNQLYHAGGPGHGTIAYTYNMAATPTLQIDNEGHVLGAI